MTFSIDGTSGLTFPNSTVQATAAAATNFQQFTSSGTFTPSAALLAKGGFVNIILVGAGGGGRSGDVSTTSSPNSGALAGGGGEVVIRTVRVTGAVTVTIGTGGAGGAAVTASTDTSGNAGAAGGNSLFGSLARAYGGAGGDTGSNAALGRGGGSFKISGLTSTTYSSDNNTLSYGGPVSGGNTQRPTDGWASGSSGFVTASFANKGGACFITGAEGGAAGSAGPNGNGAGGGASFGDGGAGGNSASNANASAGTSGAANSGGGGGGGGASVSVTTTRTSGAGGNGGSGYCLVSWVE